MRALSVLVRVDVGRVENSDENLPLLWLYSPADATVILEDEEVLADEGAL